MIEMEHANKNWTPKLRRLGVPRIIRNIRNINCDIETSKTHSQHFSWKWRSSGGKWSKASKSEVQGEQKWKPSCSLENLNEDLSRFLVAHDQRPNKWCLLPKALEATRKSTPSSATSCELRWPTNNLRRTSHCTSCSRYVRNVIRYVRPSFNFQVWYRLTSVQKHLSIGMHPDPSGKKHT